MSRHIATSNNSLAGARFNPSLLPAADLGRHHNDLRRFFDYSRPEYLEELVRRNMPEVIPFMKMHFNADWLGSMSKLIEEIERTLDAGLDRYGSGYTMNTPVIDISQPPYAANDMIVNRLVLSAHYRRTNPGYGGSASQFHRVFYSNGRRIDKREVEGTTEIQLAGTAPKSLEECLKNISYNYSTWMNGDLAKYKINHRASTLRVEVDQPKFGIPETKSDPLSVIWLNNFREIADKTQTIPTERQFEIFHYSCAGGLPNTYEESRNEKGNAILQFESALNQRLREIHGDGYNVTHYNLSFLPNTKVAYKDGKQNHFFALIQYEKAEGKVYPLTQIVAATDSASFDSVVASARSQQWLASPINRMARDLNLKCNGKYAGDMLASHITWGVVPNLDVSASRSFRIMHSILLKDGVPDKGDSFFKNISCHSGIFRGPVNGEDPSMNRPLFLDADNKFHHLDRPHERIRHFSRDRDVHDLEWMMEGAMFEFLKRKKYADYKALVMLRMYTDNNFPGPTQGFFCPFFTWQDESK